MIKKITLSIMIVTLCLVSNAQTKVFKQISDDIEVRTKTIIQNGNVIGYFVFSQLEKTSKDSFSYQITLMDENLNDIGKKEFKHKKLYLYDIAFENDVFCIGYLKRDEKEQAIEEGKKVKKYQEKAIDHEVVLQFMDLQGNFIKTITQKVNASGQEKLGSSFGRSFFVDRQSYLKESLQINEIEGKGFVVFYGDNDIKKLALYNYTGDTLWSKKVNFSETVVFSKNVKNDIFLISNKNSNDDYQSKVYHYDIITGKELYNYELKDKNDKPLTIMNITQNPKTNKLAILAKSQKYIQRVYSGQDLIKGKIYGLVTVEFNGNSKKEIKANYSIWSEEKKDNISRKGKIESLNAFNSYEIAYKDFDGNSVFGGSGIKTSPKYGSIATSTLLTGSLFVYPLGGFMIIPVVNLIAGYTNIQNVDGYMIKQDSKGGLSVVNTIPLTHQWKRRARQFYTDGYNLRNYDVIQNKTQKTSFIKVNDDKKTIIYNTSNNKIVKTIPKNVNNQVSTSVFPAKEGHVMIVQVNSKEKTTTLSIESLN